MHRLTAALALTLACLAPRFALAQTGAVAGKVALPNARPPVSDGASALISANRISTGGVRSRKTVSSLGAVHKIQAGKTINGLTITDYSLDGATVLLRNYGSTLDGLDIERISMINAGYSAGQGASVYYGTGPQSHLTFRSVYYRGTKPVTDPGDIYGLISIGGKGGANSGSGFLLEDIDMEGAWAVYSGADAKKYENRDGVSVEDGFTDGVMNRVRIAHGSDACIDMKGRHWTLNDVTCEDFRENFKVWSDRHDTRIRSISPRAFHFLILRPGVTYEVDWLELAGDPKKPLVQFENGPSTMIIHAGAFPANQVWATRDAASKGSKLILPDGTVITP